jgi:hypothetical protein
LITPETTTLSIPTTPATPPAQESSWREDNRRSSNGEQVNRVATLAMASKPSVDFSGYWQRHIKER